ncbi:hypothetical protein [Pseudoalteromonas marina]|uniref:GlyGly-CTERM sorting domain-containing protein n=1 Tax=Pseudoalteromonas marina TaxID=267375 RepID=A0ABT9FHY1_9GAMM|nr:hypothetical protein [Pseudoalteromonas marina]MDP2566372.1 hypothetical protein [Pseudoalteromonas marina]
MKKIYLNTLLALSLASSCSQAFATSFPNKTTSMIEAQAVNSDTIEFKSENDFEEKDLTYTGIMFYYTQDAVNALGSVENIEEFINNSIDISNEAYINSGIPLRRKVVGLKEIYFDYDDTLTLQAGRLSQFANARPEQRHPKLKASNYVLVNRFYEDIHRTIGAAHAPGKVSYISNQYNNTRGSITLAHEVAHNEGVQHKSSTLESLHSIAYGSTCDYFSSIMGNGMILHKFFSSPELYINGYQCGDANHDASEALKKEYTKGANYLKSSQMKNVIPLGEAKGQFKFNEFKIDTEEQEEYLLVTTSFENSTEGASVQIFTDESNLIQNFENPILISDGNNQIKEFKIRLNNEWRYSEDRTINFQIKYATEVNTTYDQISFNIDSFETDIELTSKPEVNKSESSGSLGTLTALLLLGLSLNRRKRK